MLGAGHLCNFPQLHIPNNSQLRIDSHPSMGESSVFWNPQKSNLFSEKNIYNNHFSILRPARSCLRCRRTCACWCRRTRSARCATRATSSCSRYRRLHNLAQRIEDDINQRIERTIRILFLHLSTRKRCFHSSICHVCQVITNDGIDGLTCCAHNGLHNVPEVVDDEVERCAALGDRA